MHYVYFLQDDVGGIYYGFTGDLRRRLQEHNAGHSPSTRGRIWRLVYYEAYLSKADAFERERQLKRHGQALARLRRRINDSLRQNSAG